MDKNTVIGLSLIGAILVVFTIFNQPSDAEIQKEKERIELANKQQEAKEAQAEKEAEEKEKTENTGASATSKGKKAAPVVVFKEEVIRLESEKLIVDCSTKGGIISSVQLKEFESYKNFAKNDKKVEALYLFKAGDQKNELEFTVDGKIYKTGNKPFKVKSKSATKVVLSHKVEDGELLVTYRLKNGYNVDYSVTFKGLGDVVKAENVVLNWDMEMRKTERLLSEQRRVSTICYQFDDEKLDYLSEVSEDSEVLEQDINWLAYKQSYFSAILRPKDGFEGKGSKVLVNNYGEGHEKKGTHIRKYKSTMNLNVTNTQNSTVAMSFFFGPNDYETLESYNLGYDDILNFGWGVFRWINLYAVQPIFDMLNLSGLGIGIAILLLTLIIKLILMPVQWKMFVSSAKMRILKPDIEAINAKYPNKEDAMKKQMDMMALYRESGASPLAGCVPMLFQMPILLAVFRFFPAAFELRQKSFLWAEDMSSYDSIADLGTYIPMYGDHISLFTLLMAVTTLVYTYLNSGNMAQPQQPGMPNMKVIMYIFPFMMIFFFNNYASGLSYYYFISTLMTILLMFVIKQFFVDEEKLKLKIAAARSKATKGGGTVKKKSKFMERLEEAQRLQAEMKKNKK